MSRHRNVRSLNVQEEYGDAYDDVYGHSVEDDYCVSPSTAAQFMFDRSQQQVLSTFMSREPQIPEEEEGDSDVEKDPLHDSSNFTTPVLNDLQQAKLFSCLEEIRNIIGDSTPEHVLTQAVLQANYDHERALNAILCHQDEPKPQREPRVRKSRGSRPITEPARATEAPTAVLPNATAAPGALPEEAASGNAVGPGITQGVIRMTFSEPKQTKKGFTEPASKPAAGEETADNTSNHGNPETRDPASSTDVNSVPEEIPKKTINNSLPTMGVMHKSASKAKLEKLDITKEYEKRKDGGKDSINLVVIGHVDAGKSTLMGHVLYQLGFVNKRAMHKYEQEAKKMGKASFAYAWVLDETEEERSRGVTMDIAQTRFETDTKVVTLLDAPGHKDFIPNMITGAAQADVAILVVNATRGEFETGFEMGGQTREHAMLIRSLGVSQLLVAVNKMDTVDWSQARFQEITKKLGSFLKQAGFRESDIDYIPCSGLNGDNLTRPAKECDLCRWYNGPFLSQQIDQFKPPERPIDKPFRLSVTDIFKGVGAGFSVSGTIQAGCLQTGEKVLVMPQGEMATVKGITIDDLPSPMAFAGDNTVVTLVGIEMNNIGIGSILCAVSEPISASTRFRARIVVFNIDIPITNGFPVEIHYQSLTEPAHIRRLISQLHKSSGEVLKTKPRCLVKNSNAMVEIEVDRPLCLELYKDCKDLGRFMLRSGGHTIAAGLVTEILKTKNRAN